MSSARTPVNPTHITKNNRKPEPKVVSHAFLRELLRNNSGLAQTPMVTNTPIWSLPSNPKLTGSLEKMLTQKEQETKAFLKMAEHIKFLEKECEALRNQVQELEKQLYGSR
jgi:SMC interacting uncharacterized protein involved in chromosome segregation